MRFRLSKTQRLAAHVFIIAGAVALNFSSVYACEMVRSPSEYIECALKRSPDVVAAKAEAESSEDLVEQAGRWLNPEFEAQNLYGSSLGDYQVENQLSLLQPIQLGGKRAARVETAQARASKAAAERDLQFATAIGSGLSQLLRVSQIHQEARAIESAISAYQRMLGNLRRRTVLSPEQQSTLHLFQANRETLENSLSAILAEQRIIHAELLGTINVRQISWEALDQVRIANWPEATSPDADGLLKSPLIRSFSALQALAKAEYHSASAEAWPDLRLGPMLQLNTEGPIKFQQYGFGLSFSVPIWDLRGPAKQAALRISEAADQILETRHRQQALLVSEKQAAYGLLKKRIADRAPLESFERYLGSVESHFSRGVLGPQQVIEAYRQRIENLRSRFEVERQALSLLIDVWTVRGEVVDKAIAWTKASWVQEASK